MTVYELSNALSNGGLDEIFSRIYGRSDMELLRQRARYLNAAEKFSRLYPEREEIHVFSAPGRTEIGGNHTDHQHGCVLAAAVTSDTVAIVGFHDEGIVRVRSEGHKPDVIDLSDLSLNNDETGHGGAIIRGVLAKFKEMGVKIGGFDAYTTSDVSSGIGLSSSAAFEVLIGTIVDQYYNAGRTGAVEIAKIGQYAENVYFGKASGLMDQMVSSVGGFTFIDFKDPDMPLIRSINSDFSTSGYSLCIVDTKGSHSDLSDDYSEIPNDMRTVAAQLGVEFLRDADEEEFYEKLPKIREKCTDRAVLRVIHFFDESRRAELEGEALESGRLTDFFSLVNESGDSSAMLLQNLHSPKRAGDRELMVGIAISRRFLRGSGAVRVHGGGFAGTIQAFVPKYMEKGYARELDRIFGEGSCHVLGIRQDGGIKVV